MQTLSASERAAVLQQVRKLTNHGQHAAANRLWLAHFAPLASR